MGTKRGRAAARADKDEALQPSPDKRERKRKREAKAEREAERERAKKRDKKRAREAREASPHAAAAAKPKKLRAAASAASPSHKRARRSSSPAAAASQLLRFHKRLYVDDAAGVTVATCDEDFIRRKFIAAGFTFKAAPTPRWTLARAADDALLARLCAAALREDCHLLVLCGPAPRAMPAPHCHVHGADCVLRTAGASTGDAYLDNYGRRFLKCPWQEEGDECPWFWEDGTGGRNMAPPRFLQRYKDYMAKHPEYSGYCNCGAGLTASL